MNWPDSRRFCRPARSIRTSTGSWRAISPAIRSSIGTIFRSGRIPCRPAGERQRALLDCDRAGRRGVGARRGTRGVRRRRHPRAQPRRQIPRHARGRVPRVPVVAHRDARAIEPGIGRCDQLAELVRGRQAHGLARAPGAGRDARLRLQRRQRIHPPHDLWVAAAEGCGVRQLREATGERPNIKPERPDVLLHLHVEGSTALVSVDFSGESLHRRGYRTEGGRAPLKENVAAAVLLRAGWPRIAAEGGMLRRSHVRIRNLPHRSRRRSPADAAPALEREYFGFRGWRGHDAALWEAAARRGARAARRRAGAALHRRLRHRRRCGAHGDRERGSRPALTSGCTWRSARWRRSSRPRARPGLVVANPPYGERIGAESGLPELYSELGQRAARAIPRMAGGDSHRQSAVGAQSRDLRQAHASRLQRHDRVPPAAFRT